MLHTCTDYCSSELLIFARLVMLALQPMTHFLLCFVINGFACNIRTLLLPGTAVQSCSSPIGICLPFKGTRHPNIKKKLHIFFLPTYCAIHPSRSSSVDTSAFPQI